MANARFRLFYCCFAVRIHQISSYTVFSFRPRSTFPPHFRAHIRFTDFRARSCWRQTAKSTLVSGGRMAPRERIKNSTKKEEEKPAKCEVWNVRRESFAISADRFNVTESPVKNIADRDRARSAGNAIFRRHVPFARRAYLVGRSVRYEKKKNRSVCVCVLRAPCRIG